MDPSFGFRVVTQCPAVPCEILIPKKTWADKDAFETTAGKLVGLFRDNFRAYEEGVGKAVRSAGPIVQAADVSMNSPAVTPIET